MNPSPNIQRVKAYIFVLIFWRTAFSRFWTVTFRTGPSFPPSPSPHLICLFFSFPHHLLGNSYNFSDTQPNSSNYKWQPISVTNIIAQRQRLLSALIGGESLDIYVFRGWMSNSYGRTSGNPELTLAWWLAGIVKFFFVGTVPKILHSSSVRAHWEFQVFHHHTAGNQQRLIRPLLLSRWQQLTWTDAKKKPKTNYLGHSVMSS